MGGALSGAATAGGLAAIAFSILGIATNPWLLIVAALGVFMGGGLGYIEQQEQIAKNNASNPLIEQALESSEDAVSFAEDDYVKRESSFMRNSSVGPITPAEQANTPINFERYASPQSTTFSAEVINNPLTGADETTEIYNMQTHVAAMQPQSVQVMAQSSATDNSPRQAITLIVHNELTGIPQDRRMLDNIGEYLAGQIHDKLNSGAPLSAPRW